MTQVSITREDFRNQADKFMEDSPVMQEVERASAGIEQLRTAYMEAGQKTISKVFEALFAEYPKLESINWQQYTPYFNDGDECLFNIYADPDSIEINDTELYDILEYTAEGYVFASEEAKEQANLHYLIAEILMKRIPEDLLKVAFGDHADVYVTKTEVNVTYYEHD